MSKGFLEYMKGKKLRVVYPAYNVDLYNWDRVRNILEPISRLCDLTVYHYKNQPTPKETFCKFVTVERPSLAAGSFDVLQLAMDLPEFDVLYCWSGGAYDQLLDILTAEIVEKPVVMHINGDGALSRRKHIGAGFTWVDKITQDAVDRLTLNNVDCIVPISSYLQGKILERVKNQNRVSEPVPFSIDTEHFKPSRFPHAITVGYAGRISPEKGFPFFTNVMSNTQLMFRIAGPVQMRTVMPLNCHYDGLLSFQFMHAFYAACSVIALPSYGEGIPGTILESYACGRPVMVSTEALPAEIPCFGWIVEHDVQKWKETLENLTQEEIEQKGAAARKWITEHWLTWSEFAEAMLDRFLTVTK